VAIATPVSCTPGRHSLDTSVTPVPPFTLDATADTAQPSPSTLRERIDQLEAWQAPLLDYILEPIPENRLHHLILTQEQPVIIEIASDGGAREDLGSSGWEIAIRQEVLWQCKSPTYGLMPGSFRAESYGMLSALLFIDTYCKQYDLQLQQTNILKFYCDSSSLIKRIDFHRNQSWLNPSNCLASDYDLESAIIEMIDILPITIRFIHVKSHQDDDTAIHIYLRGTPK
jgi:hypothetical protein